MLSPLARRRSRLRSRPACGSNPHPAAHIRKYTPCSSVSASTGRLNTPSRSAASSHTSANDPANHIGGVVEREGDGNICRSVVGIAAVCNHASVHIRKAVDTLARGGAEVGRSHTPQLRIVAFGHIHTQIQTAVLRNDSQRHADTHVVALLHRAALDNSLRREPRQRCHPRHPRGRRPRMPDVPSRNARPQPRNPSCETIRSPTSDRARSYSARAVSYAIRARSTASPLLYALRRDGEHRRALGYLRTLYQRPREGYNAR